jgi:hypothetical protein
MSNKTFTMRICNSDDLTDEMNAALTGHEIPRLIEMIDNDFDENPFSVYTIDFDGDKVDQATEILYGKAFKDQWCLDRVVVLMDDGEEAWCNAGQ